MKVGIIGATGLVGSHVRDILAERKYPIDSLRLFSSSRSAGSTLEWNGEAVNVEDAAKADFSGLDVVIMSAGGDAARSLSAAIAKSAVLIDNSSAWRMDSQVPLVVTGVNSSAVSNRPKNIIANPNCTTMVAMPVLAPLHHAFGLKRVIASSYQAVSGSGIRGVKELEKQESKVVSWINDLTRDGSLVPVGELYPEPIAHNVIPMTVNMVDDETDEEHKFRDETRKILELPNLSANITCVRVPIVAGHSLSIAAFFDQRMQGSEVESILSKADGVRLADIPTPLRATGGDDTLVGRVRVDHDDDHLVHLFLSGDNLRKGAALNAVQIAELLV